MLEKRKLKCDLCVVGGGLAGLSCAISAAREGIKVVLMHERPVLGGNASSEIRMWVCGAEGEYNRETGIIEEIALENLYRNPTKAYPIWDTVLYDFVRREENITLLLNCACMDASVESGDFSYNRSGKIRSITGYQLTTQSFIEVEAKFFADCSGDSILAPLASAEFRMGREDAGEFSEDSDLQAPDKMTMGNSLLLQGRETDQAIKFTPPPYATKLKAEDFNNRLMGLSNDYENFWYLELGGNKNTISDAEDIRDELLELSAGAWDYIKNSGDFEADNFELEFMGFLPGKRESRRMVGEYIITQRDISGGTVFPDEIAFGGWPIDDHYPGGFWHKGHPNKVINTPAPYSIPLRALYSKNIENLFFAGRNISMTHLAMSSIRVMATCSLLGEAVGKAAAVATANNCTPHEVYLRHIKKVQSALLEEDCFLPSLKREISPLCLSARFTASDILRNGEDRPHSIYGTTAETCSYKAKSGEEISYIFEEAQELSSLHIVFCSDLERTTLPGSKCEQYHSMRCNQRKDSPRMHLPLTLCRSFRLLGETEEGEKELLAVEDNRKRAYHLELEGKYKKLTLIPLSSWGETEEIPIVSFDFN